MKGNFFIWCAGSDRSILDRCPNAERVKHTGFGTLVLIPAVLAFVSMSYALSTVEDLHRSPVIYFTGGLVWALIILCFDRYIVSTHRRKETNREEMTNPAFYLRFFFALILGIVISHPIVLLYFDGSIEDKIKENTEAQKREILSGYTSRTESIQSRINAIDSLYRQKEEERDQQAEMVAKEIDGEVLKNAQGQVVTTGLYGKGPSAENKIKHLSRLEAELQSNRINDSILKSGLYREIHLLKAKRDSAVSAYTVSYDYLKREIALEQLKEENSIVVITQWLLMLLFILVDMLPVTFKTFSPFGLYDKILLDDSRLVKDIETESRKKALQQVYVSINEQYIQEKGLR